MNGTSTVLSIALGYYCGAEEKIFTPIIVDNPSVGIVMVRDPQINLTSRQVDLLFSLTLPYVARAFQEDINSMTKENVQDYFEHTFVGDIIFFLGNVKDGTKEPVLFSHSNFSFIDNDGVYLNGIACDPLHQGKGYAKLLWVKAITMLKEWKTLLAVRTINVRLISILKKTINDTPIFPLDKSWDPTKFPEIATFASKLAKEKGWERFNPNTLVISKAFPLHLIAVSREVTESSTPLSLQIDELINWNSGDALLCVCRLTR